MKSINERISEIIKARGIKKIEFAKRLKLSQPYVSELCAGKCRPSERTIADICREFHVNEAWLRTGEGEMFASMSREQEIAEFFADLFSDNDSAKIAIVQALARIPESGWEMIKDFALDVAAAVKREEEEPVYIICGGD